MVSGREKWILGVVGLLTLWIAAFPSRLTEMLKDSDTVGILAGIKQRGNPISYFWTDWPLDNHFYRPFPSLSFAFDAWLWPDWTLGFAISNAVIVALLVPLVFWLGKFLSDSDWVGLGSAVLFTLWVKGIPMLSFSLGFVVFWTAGFALLWGLDSSKRLGFVGFWWLLYGLIQPIVALNYRTVGWLPGRTATIMALFAFGAMIAWVIAFRSKKNGLYWAAGILFFCALASYEQAAMLPGLLIILWLVLRDRSGPFLKSVPKLALGVPFLILGGYAVLRTMILPASQSKYQSQQFRDFGGGVITSLGDFFFPATREWIVIQSWASLLPESLILPNFYLALLNICLSLLGLIYIYKLEERTKILWLWFASFVAFSPMAFLHMFEHYYYFPMALRAIAIAMLVPHLWGLVSGTRARITSHRIIPESSSSEEQNPSPNQA